MKENKILFFVTSLNSGGIENYLLRYLNYDLECKAMVLCKNAQGGQLEESYAVRLGAENIIKLPIGYVNLFSWIKLYQFIKKHNICTVCDFTGEVSGIPIYIAYLARCDRRITFYRHSRYAFRMNIGKKIYIKLNKWMIETFSSKILSNSKAALDFYHPKWRLYPDRYQTIYNGISNEFVTTEYSNIEVRKELGIPKDAFVVGHTGRVDRSKNHETILKTAYSVCTESNHVHFVLAGMDTEKLIIDKYSDRIHTLGYRTDIARLLSVMDLFYFPSLTEGQPNSLIEAMVKGKAILASDIPSIKESLPEQMYHHLVPPLDVAMASKKIVNACNNDVLLDNMRCREWAIDHFKASKLFNQFKKELI